ncbi:MAG: ribonuclease P [Ignisphaera sp.]|uniref:Ribonuclease P protein component 4 n=1 Tax=Ignisphaera aggregans TaxID=334771 RepID=A0A7C4H505_9CREN
MHKDKLKDIAIQRMYILYSMGVEASRMKDYRFARRYGELIYRISMRNRVKIPRSIKRWICKNCKVIMVPGVNVVIRTRRKGKTLRVITRCLVCGWIHRYEFLRCRKNGEA